MKGQYELSERNVGNLAGMMIALELDEENVLSCALELLQWYIEILREGRIVASVDEKNKKYRELNLDDLKKRMGLPDA